jgi:hypothetical protein
VVTPVKCNLRVRCAYTRKLFDTQLFWTPVGIVLLLGDIGIAVAASILYVFFERPIRRRWSSPRKMEVRPAVAD